MRLFRLPFILNWLYPYAIFRIKTTEKILCLTFDDGPDPDSTPQLITILEKHDVKALFFCNGNASEKYPGLIKLLISKGHMIGNHGYNHQDGWVTSLNNYISDVDKAAQFTSCNIFRPPYGHLKYSQYRKLKKTFKIVFWDIMPYDFDSSFGGEKSFSILKEKIRPGSIIVLHDKPVNNSLGFIEEFLLFSKKKGYRFDNSDLFDSIHG